MLPTERKGVQWRGVPSALAGTASSLSALEVVGFLRCIGRNKLFLPPAHPWVCYWKLVELGTSLLDSFELELDWFSTDVLHPPRGLTEPLRGHMWRQWRPRRDQYRGELFGFGPPLSSWAPSLYGVPWAGAPSICRDNVLPRGWCDSAQRFDYMLQ